MQEFSIHTSQPLSKQSDIVGCYLTGQVNWCICLWAWETAYCLPKTSSSIFFPLFQILTFINNIEEWKSKTRVESGKAFFSSSFFIWESIQTKVQWNHTSQQLTVQISHSLLFSTKNITSYNSFKLTFLFSIYIFFPGYSSLLPELTN